LKLKSCSFCVDDSFHINWNPSDGISWQNYSSPKDYPTSDDICQAGTKFSISCPQIYLLELRGKPHRRFSQLQDEVPGESFAETKENYLELCFHGKEPNQIRSFYFDNNEFNSLSEMVEALISNGIYVLSSKKRIHFNFTQDLTSQPIHIRLHKSIFKFHNRFCFTSFRINFANTSNL
jgi:hypothetical protein